MELRHLRYFVAVAEEENVTRAAARLHVSQPPLSRQIRDLEEELGVELFRRAPKAVRLTEVGEVFLEEARAVLARTDEAMATVRAVSSGSRGEIHVAYAPSLAVEILPRALRCFQERRPGVKVTLHDLSTEAMLTGLIEKRLHLALMIRSSPKARRGLIFLELRRYAVCAAAHPSHPLARRSKLGLKDLAPERLIAYGRAEYPEYHEWLTSLFKPLGATPLIGEEHDSATSLIASLETGHGVAIVPECLACLAGPRLNIRPIAGRLDPFRVGVVRCAGEPADLVQQFIESAR